MLWSDLFVKNIHKQLSVVMEGSNDLNEKSKDYIIGRVEGFMLNALMKEIANSSDSFESPSESKNLNFPGSKTDSLPNVMGNSKNTWRTSDNLAESRMFDRT